MPFAGGPILCYEGNGRFRTVGTTAYVGETDVITIPSDFPTDLASVPRIFWALIPPTGAYEKAAVLHDFGCRQLRDGTCELSARDVDGLFRRVMRESGVGFVTRWVMWAGVRWGALTEPPRRAGWWRDTPAVAAVTAAALAAAALTTYVADRAAHAAARHLHREEPAWP